MRENRRQGLVYLDNGLVHLYAQVILEQRQELQRLAGIAGEEVAGRKNHTRRGDKHKKLVFTQHNQYHRGNNRADRPTFTQCNKKNNKRKY